MSVDSDLGRIASALEVLVKHFTNTEVPVKRPVGRPPKMAEAPEAPAEPENFLDESPAAPEPTLDDVRAALKACQDRIGAEKARGVLRATAGVDLLRTLTKDKWAAVIDAANKAK